MFRRRRRENAGDAGSEHAWGPGGPEPEEDAAAAAGPAEEDQRGGPGPGGGPWDAGDDVPDAERIDLGSLRVPVAEGFEIQVNMTEDQVPAWVTVVRGDSGLQLMAFASRKSGGLWDDVRREIAAQITQDGGEAEEADGPFGVELRARIAPPRPARGPGHVAAQPARFLGVDGPRWFLRGMLTGPAARRTDLAEPLERVFADVVVVRGSHPAPPRDPLEIVLPEDERKALGQEAEEPASGRWQLNPFERGPEITETR